MGKICKITVFVLFAWGFTSCGDWLDIKPELEVYEETMFEKTQGYYMVLTGAYAKLSERDLYGEELLYGAVEAWGRSYVLDEYYHPEYYAIANFYYDRDVAKKIATSLWEKSYRVIAEVNNLIQNLEADHEIKFTGGDMTRNMILGEAYAVRAMMHFEMLRIFAKAPVADGGGTSAMIPYVTQFPSKVNSPVPTKDILKNIIADLEKAKEWVKPFDTDKNAEGYKSFWTSGVSYRLKPTQNGTSGHSGTEFFRYRAHRLNYYAITQLLARVALYAGDKEKAFLHANEIITVVNGGRIFKLTLSGYIGDPQSLITCAPKYQDEVLFGGDHQELKDWLIRRFWDTGNQGLQLRVKEKNVVFADNLFDKRLAAIPVDKITKFAIDGKDKTTISMWENLIPIMRVPESYYIAAEAILEKDKAKAVEIFNKFVEARGNVSSKFDPQALPTNEDFMEAIIKEYRREYLGEGQMVYVYKRLNIPLRDGAVSVEHNGQLVMPVPDSEEALY